MAGKAFISIIAWNYLPDFITSTILKNMRSRLRTPVTDWHYRVTFSVVVLLYLSYNLVDAVRTAPSNYYQLLNVMPDVDESGLKSAFRSFARKNHPDRVGDQGTARFMTVRKGYEALMDPVKRWAYDRFGPKILECTTCATPREYLHHGLFEAMGFHIISGVALLFFSALGRSTNVAFWRYVFWFMFMISEVSLLFYPSPSSSESEGFSFLRKFFPTWTPYQYVLVLHQVFVFISIALTRVAPVLFPGPTVLSKAQKLESEKAILEKIKQVDREIYGILETELRSIQPGQPSREARSKPLVPDEKTMDILTREMENLVIERQLASAGGDIARARREALRKSREEGANLARPWPRRTASRIQLPSPVSRSATPASQNTEPIDVDALDEEVGAPRPVFKERVNNMWQPRVGHATNDLFALKFPALRERSKSL